MRYFKKPFLLLLILILIVGLSRNFFLQIDLTYDKRNSLSKSTLTQIKELKDPLRIDVFLSGDLPSTYLRFRNEIDALLSHLKYTFRFVKKVFLRWILSTNQNDLNFLNFLLSLIQNS